MTFDKAMSIPPPLPKPTQPTVVLLFRIYCLCFAAFLTLGSIISSEPQLGFGDAMISDGNEQLREQLLEEEREKNRHMLIVSCILIPALLLGSALPPRQWSHIYGIVILVMTSLFCLPLVFTIPLFIFWIKPESKRYFAQ